MNKGSCLSPGAIVDVITRPQRSGLESSEAGGPDSAIISDHPVPVDVDIIDVATRVAMVRLKSFFRRIDCGRFGRGINLSFTFIDLLFLVAVSSNELLLSKYLCIHLRWHESQYV